MPRLKIQFLATAILLTALGLASYTWITSRMSDQTGSGVAMVGGPFTLTDQDGRVVTDRDFAGKYMLIFFGYTYCPDICPTELQVMTAALDSLGAQSERIQPIFISIDPARDTPEVLKAYVSNFGPRLIGLTGTPDQIAAVARNYRVYFARAGNTQSASDYLMDHSSIIYLMGPDGRFLKHMTYTTDIETLASQIKKGITVSP
ncbi:SCO family protein [Aestuariivirga sp.]|jgi:cytochrome oxidase Cu insertion factor (SCO1/SenC/PrrC family)|uniref:SCO family protein n=1 Tax=Aestuariivirga sp. TaxID=2650926 RepID=UPI00378416F5